MTSLPTAYRRPLLGCFGRGAGGQCKVALLSPTEQQPIKILAAAVGDLLTALVQALPKYGAQCNDIIHIDLRPALSHYN